MRPSRWLLGLVPLLVLVACRDATDEAEPASLDTAATERAKPDRPWPRVRSVLVSDRTEADQRPVDLSLEADMAMRKALRGDGAFVPAALDDDGACDVRVDVMYGLLDNGEMVARAERGVAKIAIEAEASCPRDGDPEGEIEGFVAQFDEAQAFGPKEKLTGPEALRPILDRAALRAARALYGQVIMRHATDARVLEVLESSDHVGLLMEAASEAGERRLDDAQPHLVRLTAHPEPVVGLRAGAALGLQGKSTPDVLAALARMTEGSDPERHLIAIHAMGDIGGKEASRYLDTLAVGHPLEAMRAAARLAAERARGR